MADTPLEQLFGVSRASFVDARQRLVKELKAAGRKDQAAAIAKLPKPTVAAWALNQLARRHADLVKRLGRAGTTLRRVQLEGAGGDDRQAYSEAVAAQRAALAEARTALEALLREEGSAAPVHLVEGILRALRAGAASDEAQAGLEAGQFVREPEAQDLSLLAGLAVFVPGERKAAAPPATRAKAPEAKLSAAEARAAREAEETAARAQARARVAAERAVKEQRAAVEKAAALHQRREEETADARAALAAAEGRAVTSAAALKDARAALAEAERALREHAS